MAFSAAWQRPWRRLGTAVVALAFTVHALAAPVRAQAQVTGRHAALVIDANTGRILHQSAADDARYPSLAGQADDALHAVRADRAGPAQLSHQDQHFRQRRGRAPSKLDLDEGDEIAVIDAIKALVTKSPTTWRWPWPSTSPAARMRFAQTDDAEGAATRHAGHAFPQCLRPARCRAGHHRAGHDHPGAAAAGRFPAALSAVFDPHLHLGRRYVPQPQHAALQL